MDLHLRDTFKAIWIKLKIIISNKKFRFSAIFIVICLITVFISKINLPSAEPSTIPQNVPVNTNITKLNASKKNYGIALGDTLMGLSEDKLKSELQNISTLGVQEIRIDMSWADIQPNSSSQYSWSALDNIVNLATQDKLKILGTIAYTPSWASPSSCGGNSKCAPANNYEFANFAAAVARRYNSDGVKTFEIWNEPNLTTFWLPSPNSNQYTQLLKASYVAIKQSEPNDTIISGGLGDLDNYPQSINQQTFLTAMYNDGAKPYFDALGFHPYSFPALPSYVASWSGWSMMNDIPGSIRSIMIANGDSLKQIWITEYGAPTGGSGAIATLSNFNLAASPDHVDNDLQTEMLKESVTDYQNDSWLGAYFWYSYQDLGASSSSNENFFGLIQTDGTPKPAYLEYKQLIATN